MCFANPGTSEMHFVAALDSVPEMRGVLCLSEGVVTGAADGYGRMTGRPAAVLLHLGPGLGNGLANLHNARRARTPLLAVVGDHATYHKRLDALLESDIESLARPVSVWVRRSMRAQDVAADAVDAVAAASAPPGGVATLILPADVSWTDGAQAAAPRPPRRPAPVPDEVTGAAARALRSGEPCVILLGGAGVRQPALDAASRVAVATGARLFSETFPARQERGAGLPAVERLAYLAEFATAQLKGARHLILAGARSPVSFFAYPGLPGSLVPDGCEVHVLAEPGDDVTGALASLADAVAAGAAPAAQPAQRPALPGGDLTAETAAAVIGALLPEGAIVSDESVTTSVFLAAATAGAPPHDWLTLTGGAIGQGLPLAAGAAIASRDGRSSRWKPTGAPCTRSRRCGRTRGKASTSPRSSSATAGTRSWPWNCSGSGRPPPGTPPATCSTYPGRRSTSRPWPPEWASRPPGPPPRRNSPPNWARP